MEFPDEVYRDICSIKTLYSTREGFFKDFVKVLLDDTDPNWIENVFKRADTPTEKIRACCKDEKVWSRLRQVLTNISKVFRKKSEDAAKNCRIEGDLLCKTKEFKKALMAYSQSIIRACQTQNDETPDGYILPFGYKGRANALFHLGRYKESLGDLNMALREKFPDALKYQVYKQMGECHGRLSDTAKARISFQVALKLLDEQLLKLETTAVKHGTKADKAKDVNLRKLLHKERVEIKKMMTDLSLEKEPAQTETPVFVSEYSEGTLPEIEGGPNERYPNASNLIKIRQSEGTGRFAAAADKISVGSTLLVEPPHASVLVPRMNSSHCHHCFIRLIAPIPCKTCSGVAFCSTQCRDAATDNYHRYECEILGLFMGSGMSLLAYLAVRMVTQEGLSFFKSLHSKLTAGGGGESVDGSLTEREAEYLKVYNLTTHSNLRTGRDYFRRAVMAIFLVRCLRETDYFGEKGGTDAFSEDEILTASVILHHLELLQFNAHEIYETRVPNLAAMSESKAAFTAIGIYPTASLFNHECSPSVTRYYSGKNIIIRAVRPLVANEVLSDNYGPHYGKKRMAERIRELTSRYWFKCECKACLEDWPMIQDIPADGFNIRCTTPHCTSVFDQKKLKKNSGSKQTCWICLREINLQDVLAKKAKADALFEKGLECLDERNFTDALPLFTRYLNKILQLGSPPCRELFLTQEALRTCYAQTGNVWILDERQNQPETSK